MRVFVIFVASVIAMFVAAGASAEQGDEWVITQEKVDQGLAPCDDEPGFPCKLTQSGSYRLGGNLSGVPAYVNGLALYADNIQIDLAGFTITAEKNANHGIANIWENNTWPQRITVRNGTVIGFSGSGVGLCRSEHAIVESVRVIGPVGGDKGILVGNHSAVRSCHVLGYGSSIYAGDGCLVADNTVEDGGKFCGIQSGSDCIVVNNTVGGRTAHGICLERGSKAMHNICFENGESGIRINGNNVFLQGNTCEGNKQYGIEVLYDASGLAYKDNLLRANGAGSLDLTGSPIFNLGGNVCHNSLCP